MPVHEGERYLTEGRIMFGDGTSVQLKDAIVEIGDTGPADDGAEDAGVYGRLGESMEFSASGVCVWHTHGKFEKLMRRTRNRMVRSVRYAKRFKERVRRAELKGKEKVTIGKPWMLWGLKEAKEAYRKRREAVSDA